MTKRDMRTEHHITAMLSPYIYYYLIYTERETVLSSFFIPLSILCHY